MNPFEILGLQPRLVIDREELHQAFRDAGKSSHPDAGGSEEGFAALQQALAALQSPAMRLRHWLETKGVEVEARGSIGPEMMDLFARVGEVSQGAEDLIRRREAARSVLAKALLEGETHRCREAVEEMISVVEQAIEATCANFGPMEQGSVDAQGASVLYRDLSFLEKWRAGLRALYSRLL